MWVLVWLELLKFNASSLIATDTKWTASVSQGLYHIGTTWHFVEKYCYVNLFKSHGGLPDQDSMDTGHASFASRNCDGAVKGKLNLKLRCRSVR